MVEFLYNNVLNSSTQQTPFYVNHGLHPKFDIRGVCNIMNPVARDWTMWLANIQAQLVSKLEKAQIWYKDNVDVLHKDQPNFKVGDQI